MGCAYCYVPNVLKMPRAEFDVDAVARPNFLDHLRKDARKYQALGISAQTMLSFTSDVYNPRDTSLTRPTLQILIEHGLGICVLTKGGTKALADHDLYRPSRDAFASTLTSLDDSFSRKWERGAALPGDRIAALRAFHEAGIFTWVSLEPTINTASSLQIVRETHSFRRSSELIGEQVVALQLGEGSRPQSLFAAQYPRYRDLRVRAECAWAPRRSRRRSAHGLPEKLPSSRLETPPRSRRRNAADPSPDNGPSAPLQR